MTPDARVIETAPAKVNLFLHVGDRRTDGYHDLESLAVFADCADTILIERGDALSLTVAGPFAAALPADENNLGLLAARRLASHAGVRAGARITLAKKIPVAAGLGGGSADAAAVLRGLNRLWSLGLSHDELREIAACAGADVPVCIDSGPAWMEGRGERVASLPSLPESWLLLVNPGVPVRTSEVFAKLRRRSGLGVERPAAAFEDVHALTWFLRSTANDLEDPAKNIAPEIGEVLEEIGKLPKTLLTRMSGSGATCFAIFANHDDTCSALASLQLRRPAWWCTACGLAPRAIAPSQLR